MRINDNISLTNAQKKYSNIVPIFIFDPKQIYEKNNKYFQIIV